MAAPSQPTNALAPQSAGAVTKNETKNETPMGKIKRLLGTDDFKAQLMLALPKHMSKDRQLRVMLTTLTRVPKLANCSIESLFTAMLDCSQMGLEPDGRRAHLIPYGNECKLIVDYKGLIELIMRSGFVDYIDAFVVYRNDKFKVIYGSDPRIEHEPVIEGESGPIIGAYAVAHLNGSSKAKFVWMKVSEIDAIRNRSASGKSGPWVTDYEEMAKKTTIRRISKTLPQSAELSDALDKEAAHDPADGIPQNRFEDSKPAKVSAVTGITEGAQADPPQQEPPPPAQDSHPELEPAKAAEAPKQPAATVNQPATTATNQPAQPAQPAQPSQPSQPPQQAATSQPAQPPQKPPTSTPASSPQDAITLAALAANSGVTEKQICVYLHTKFKVPPCETLSAVQKISPRRLTILISGWDALKEEIKAVVV